MKALLAILTLMVLWGDPVPPAAPILSSVTPSRIAVASPDTGVALAGSNFRSNARAVLNQTQPLTTNFISSTALRAIIPAVSLKTPGTASILVSQSTGSNQSASKSLSITIAAAPTPTITTISPAHVVLGSPAFTLTVNGTNFSSSSVVMWDSTALVTTFVSAAQLTAAVPNTLYNLVGTSSITVKDTSGVSAPATMTKVGVLTITAVALPGGQVNTVYQTTTLTATGGTAPYTWTLATGSSLPAGLTLSSAGVISGTPTGVGITTFPSTVTFTVVVTDATGTLARRKFTFGKAVSGK